MEETIEKLEAALDILNARRPSTHGLGAPILLLKFALDDLRNSPYRFSEDYKGNFESYKKALAKNIKDL